MGSGESAYNEELADRCRPQEVLPYSSVSGVRGEGTEQVL